MNTLGTMARRRALLISAMACFLLINPALGQSQNKFSSASPQSQKFDTPQQAAEALIRAAADYDVASLQGLFGPDGKSFISSADPVRDKSIGKAFAAKAEEKMSVNVDPKTQARATIVVGQDDWPFPVPLVKQGGKWYFDSTQGAQEILIRRIGANELDAIQICRGFVDAQEDYASEIHDDSKVNQYAQKIISTPGKHDGLYWENSDGTAGGPISEAVARAIQEGYTPGQTAGYHGYYFKVLKGQGAAAPLGRLDYVIEGAMIGGFGLLAFPSEYRVTGVKSFLVSYDGVVFEKDLGPETLKISEATELYNPDKTWRRTDDQWPADLQLGSD